MGLVRLAMPQCQNLGVPKMAEAIFVIGAGGHAKVIIGLLKALGQPIAGVFDDDPAKKGQSLLGVPVLGPVESAREYPGLKAVIGIGDNRIRKRIAECLRDVNWVSLIHPSAWVDPSAQVGEGSVVFAGTVVQPDVKLGRHVVVNTGATVDHDCFLDDYAQVTPGVHLAGGVVLEEGVMMGTGSVAIPLVRVGAWTTVGAGAVVTRDLPSHVTAVGIPAKVIKQRH
jgi:sugar O-acyltransferase (sialic acid O-acetyltransferase NeuD family)